MTARLTRWLTTLDNFEVKMAQLPSVRRYGRLTRATVWCSHRPNCRWGRPVSSSVRMVRRCAKSKAKWLASNGQRLFLMPLEEVEGILPRVYARSVMGDNLHSGKQLPLGLPCSVAFWMAAENRWTDCHRRIPAKPSADHAAV